jgi:hypothetical protein
MAIDPRTLQIGQTVAVKELTFGVQFTQPNEGEAGWTVVEIGRDHLLLDDADGGRRQIPLYLINKSTLPPVEPREAA